jgi:hypothetical protein
MSDATTTDQAPDEPTPPNPVAKEPAEGGEVPDAGPGADRADDTGQVSGGGAA